MTGFSGLTGGGRWEDLLDRIGAQRRTTAAGISVSRLGKCVATFVNLEPRRVKSVGILVKNMVILTKSEGVLVKNMCILVKSAGVLTKDMGILVKSAGVPTKDMGLPLKSAGILIKRTAILAKNTGVLTKSEGIPTLFRHNFVNSVNSVKNTRSGERLGQNHGWPNHFAWECIDFLPEEHPGGALSRRDGALSRKPYLASFRKSFISCSLASNFASSVTPKTRWLYRSKKTTME